MGIKGLLLHERVVAEDRPVCQATDRRDCYWLYVVTNCNAEAKLQNPIKASTLFLGHDAFFLENGKYQAPHFYDDHREKSIGHLLPM